MHTNQMTIQKRKKAKDTKKCIVKKEITFKNYADASFNDKVIVKS